MSASTLHPKNPHDSAPHDSAPHDSAHHDSTHHDSTHHDSTHHESTHHTIMTAMDQQALIKRFQSVYQQLNTHNAQSDLLDSIYTQNIEFIDPLHRVKGLSALKDYCQNMYANLNSAHFDFYEHSCSETSGFIRWSLTFEHKRLNQKKAISVEGTSHLVFNGNKIVRHQDYFDAGALLYEHIPVLGYGILKIKHRIKTLS